MGLVSNYYIIKKDEILDKLKASHKNPLEFVKKSLTVIPKKIGKAEVFPMITYKIIDDVFYLPYKWGINTFGITGEDLSIGHSINVNLNAEFPPRNDQVKLIDDMMLSIRNDHRTLLSAYAATGKTYCALYALCQLKVTTAIIVGKSALIDQWRSKIKLFTDLTDDDIGLVKSTKFDYVNKKVVLISTDSFYNKDFSDDFLRYFGFVIFDEHHNFNAQQKFKSLGKLYAKYQLGMSATHDRVDNRDKVSELWFGEIAVVATEADPIPIDVLIVPVKHTEPLPINYSFFEKNNLDPRWSEITKLSQLDFRNKLACKIINYEYRKNNYMLCVSSRTEQLQIIYDLLISSGVNENDISMVAKKFYKSSFKINIEINLDSSKVSKYKDIITTYNNNSELFIKINKSKITGKGFKNKKECYDFFNFVNRLLIDECTCNILLIGRDSVELSKDQINDNFNDKSKKILLVTYGLLREGISIWWMSRLIDLTPESRAEQLLGRIGRKAENGETKVSPLCYTLFDHGNIQESIKRTHINRLRNYKKLPFVKIKKINMR